MTILEALGAFALLFIIVAAIGFTFLGWKFSATYEEEK